MMSRVWIRPEPLLLASASHTRRGLLERAGLSVECRPAAINERTLEAGLDNPTPVALALHLAEAKALSVSKAAPTRLVVGADQVLALGTEIFHKPSDPEAAMAQLRRLAGRSHLLHAAVAIAENGKVIDSFVDEACLTMRPLEPRAIARYVDSAGAERVTASVGGYQVEGFGIHLFSKVEGDHSTILGLPLIPLLTRLRARDCLAF